MDSSHGESFIQDELIIYIYWNIPITKFTNILLHQYHGKPSYIMAIQYSSSNPSFNHSNKSLLSFKKISQKQHKNPSKNYHKTPPTTKGCITLHRPFTPSMHKNHHSPNTRLHGRHVRSNLRPPPRKSTSGCPKLIGNT